MSFILELLRMIIGAVTGEVFDQLKIEDKAEYVDTDITSIDLDKDPDDLSDLDVFDGLLDETSGSLRQPHEVA